MILPSEASPPGVIGRSWNHLLGYFLNTVVLRADLSGDPSFSELMRRMRRLTLEALQHDRVPWGQLIQQLAPH